jgi:hypothetical protein
VTEGATPVAEVDPRPQRLLSRYASLSGTQLFDAGDHLIEVHLPPSEAKWFGGRREILVALAPSALEERPDAEILVNGSLLLQQLIDAIRDRGSLDERGVIQPDAAVASAVPEIGVPLEGEVDGAPLVDDSLLPVGRLLARLSIRAGPSIVERLVESSIVDLTTGKPVAQAVAARCDEAAAASPASPEIATAREPMRRLATGTLLKTLFADLEAQTAAELAGLAQESGVALTAELTRLDGYYRKMSEEMDPEDDAKAAKDRRAAISRDREKRRAEEESRYGVQVTVHPVQLVEWRLPVQRVRWSLRGPTGAKGELTATRTLVGDTTWQIACPSCGETPRTLRLCTSGHLGCAKCTERCGVCSAGACRDHGLAICAVEGHPVCGEHSLTCGSCDRTHCELHAGHCAAADHKVCSSCAVTCARCAKAICKAHGVQSSAESPRGARWLCSACTVNCEGGANEPVGLDEVERCTSCDRHICADHVAHCAVDRKPHCSRHLRRSDGSGRLACEEHRAPCHDEPDSAYASDELYPCATCGNRACEKHHGICAVDGRHHCRSHLLPLRDAPGKAACEAHRETCSIDKLAFSIGGTKACPVCGKSACPDHLHACKNCGRATCTRHTDGGLCTTCGKLAETSEPSDDVLSAVAEATGSETDKVRGWRTATDGAHTVVEIPLGWGRRVVLTLRHGEQRAESVVQHGLLGKKRVR